MDEKCNRCGARLDRIRYIEPDWEGHYANHQRRPPLCEPCWKKADQEAAERAEARREES